MTAAGSLTVIAISIALIALIQVAGILVLWRATAQLAAQVKQLQARAEAMEHLVTETAERVSATADEIGRTARSLGHAAGAFGRVMQGAGVGAWIIRRITAGAAPVAAVTGEAAARAARLALVKTRRERAGTVVRAIGPRRPTEPPATAAGPSGRPRHRHAPPQPAAEAPAAPAQEP